MTQKPSTASSPALRMPLIAGAVLATLAAGILWWTETNPRHEAERPGHTWDYRSEEYENAVDKALAWVDRLDVDPVALQARGVKGKKKLAEALTVYSIALRYEGDPGERRRLQSRLVELGATTEQAGYHNMHVCDAREFRQNSMSYLRVLWLLKEANLDTMAYARALAAAKPRFDEDLPNRGPWQRAMFARYYDDLGLEKPNFLEENGAERGVIARRVPATQYDRFQAYQLTHEVFVAYDYGFAESQDTLSASDLAYLTNVLPQLVEEQLALGEADLLSELLTGMALLGLRSHPSAKRGVDYLLQHQNADGTWGDYEQERAKIGALVDQHLYLHTTLAGMQALFELYERH